MDKTYRGKHAIYEKGSGKKKVEKRLLVTLYEMILRKKKKILPVFYNSDFRLYNEDVMCETMPPSYWWLFQSTTIQFGNKSELSLFLLITRMDHGSWWIWSLSLEHWAVHQNFLVIFWRINHYICWPVHRTFLPKWGQPIYFLKQWAKFSVTIIPQVRHSHRMAVL